MGFRDLFYGRNNRQAESQDRAEEVRTAWQEERQTFLDSLKVDVPQTACQPANATAPASSSQDDGRERGDDMTQTRNDPLKGESAAQETAAGAIERTDEAGPVAQEGAADALDDSMDDGDGLSL